MPPFFDQIVHKALSSDIRREVLLSLAEKDKYLSEISAEIDKKPQTVDFHLNVLSEIGLIESKWDSGKKYYHLKEKKILDFLRDRKPLPPELRPKPPHEIMIDMWDDMKKRMDKIDNRLIKIENKLK